MTRLLRALRVRRLRREELRRHLRRAHDASAQLQEQYRAQPAIPLAAAGLGGFALARLDPKWRPPRQWTRHLWRWGMLVLRGLI